MQTFRHTKILQLLQNNINFNALNKRLCYRDIIMIVFVLYVNTQTTLIE